MDNRADYEKHRLFARLDDLLMRAEHGEVAVSAFLSPREIHFGSAELTRRRASFVLWGGYGGAERQRIYLLPDYIVDAQDIGVLSEYGFSDGIAVICAEGSGFSRLSHRDFMGSLLGLGLERSVIGDITVTDDGRRATVFCDETIAPFLISEWTKAGNDKIKVAKAELPPDFAPARRTVQIHDTVASPRLDAIVAALCSISREKARELVENEVVEADYEAVVRPDKILCAPCILSVRGYGKFNVLSVSEQTRKGRYRLIAEKYL